MKKVTVVIKKPTKEIGLGMDAFGGMVSAVYDFDLEQQVNQVKDYMQKTKADFLAQAKKPCDIESTVSVMAGGESTELAPDVDHFSEIEFALESLVEYCNNSGFGTSVEVMHAEAALERVYQSRAALAKHGG